MKTIKRFLLLFICIVLLMPVINSCKKGAEDPFFSIYSRKHRLCQEWNFSYYKKVQQHNDVIVYEEFDGTSLKKVEGGLVIISDASMQLTFKPNGSYIWGQTVKTDTSVYIYSEEGDWYFTGGGKNSDTKYKELLALQKTNVTETLQTEGNVNTTNYTGSGNLDAGVFKIIELSSKEVKLELKVETDYIQNSPNDTDLKILTIIVTLTKSS